MYSAEIFRVFPAQNKHYNFFIDVLWAEYSFSMCQKVSKVQGLSAVKKIGAKSHTFFQQKLMTHKILRTLPSSFPKVNKYQNENISHS